MPVLFRMLYCCGLRPAEAVRLRVSDVDLYSGVLHIRESKNDNSPLMLYVPSLRLQQFLFCLAVPDRFFSNVTAVPSSSSGFQYNTIPVFSGNAIIKSNKSEVILPCIKQ